MALHQLLRSLSKSTGTARVDHVRMLSTMNLKIKFHESFRLFAPAILCEHVDELFEMRPNEASPYKLLIAPVSQDKRLEIDEAVTGLDRLHQKRSVVHAITHVDCSARVPGAMTFAALGTIAALFSLVAPRVNRVLYVGLTLLGFPIGFVLS